MYLKEVNISGVKNFDSLTWRLPSDKQGAGWHVILGDNGSGKSTFIKAVSLIFIGPKDAARTQSDFTKWVKTDRENAVVKVEIEDDTDAWAGLSGVDFLRDFQQRPNFEFDGNIGIKISKEGAVDPIIDRVTLHPGFSSSFGPLRRFTGGDPIYEGVLASYPFVARHLSAFSEAVAFTNILDWLKDLRFSQLEEPQSQDSQLLNNVIRFLNQDGLLPNNARIHGVSSKGVVFKDAQGTEIRIEDASDGHRSILSMILELIRQMAIVYKATDIFSEDGTVIICPGVVLVDEIDAHLHPRWQRRIGKWLCRHFPNIQFIVTTHSPLVCQSAVNGTVFRLARPGHDQVSEMLSGEPLQRLLYGNILEAYGSGAFGPGIGRSEEGEAKIEELADLNIRARRGDLSESEQAKRYELMNLFSTEVY